MHGPVDLGRLAGDGLGLLKDVREDEEEAKVRGAHAQEEVGAPHSVPGRVQVEGDNCRENG